MGAGSVREKEARLEESTHCRKRGPGWVRDRLTNQNDEDPALRSVEEFT